MEKGEGGAILVVERAESTSNVLGGRGTSASPQEGGFAHGGRREAIKHADNFEKSHNLGKKGKQSGVEAVKKKKKRKRGS